MLDSGHKKVAAGRSDTNDRKQSFCKRLIKTLIFPLLTFITAGNVTSANCRPSEQRKVSGGTPHGKSIVAVEGSALSAQLHTAVVVDFLLIDLQ